MLVKRILNFAVCTLKREQPGAWFTTPWFIARRLRLRNLAMPLNDGQLQDDRPIVDLLRQKKLAYLKAYREANREKIKAGKRAYSEANREKENANKRAYRAKNLEKMRARDRSRYQENPEKESTRKKAYRQANLEKARSREKVRRDRDIEKARAYQRDYRAANAQKVRARSKAWRDANLEKARSYLVKWKKANPDKDHESRLAYYRDVKEKHPERQREKDKKYREANPEKIAAKSRVRRARKKAAPRNTLSVAETRMLFARSPHCHWCKRSWSKAGNPTLDHVIPLAAGGSHALDNVVASCRTCNARKQHKHYNPVTGQGILL